MNANQGVAQVIDKTFSKIEVEKELTKTQRLLQTTKKAIEEQARSGVNPKRTKKRQANGKITLYGEAFVEEWYRNNHFEFERKLKQAIIDRIDDKNKLLASNDMSSMFKNIRETKMAIESEMEQMHKMKSEMVKQNRFSAADASKFNSDIQKLQSRLRKLAQINAEQMAGGNPMAKVEVPPQKVIKRPSSMNKISNQPMKVASFNDIKGKRDTNKQFSIRDKLELEGRQEKDLLIRQEFYRLRGGDHGIDKTRIERDLDDAFDSYVEKVKNKRADVKKERSVQKDSHNYFISKANAEQSERLRRLKQRQLEQIIEKNSKSAARVFQRTSSEGG